MRQAACPKARSEGEETLALHLRTEPRIPEPLRQHRFCARRWTFDFARPDRYVALATAVDVTPRKGQEQLLVEPTEQREPGCDDGDDEVSF